MPLTRSTITAASRVMLPTYAVFFTVVGLTYLLTPLDQLLSSPGLASADAFLDMRAWGWLFLGAAALMVAALVRHQRDWFRGALLFCALCMGFFAVVLGVSGLSAWVHGEGLLIRELVTLSGPAGWLLVAEGPTVGPSLAAWSWPALCVAACSASYRSLTIGER